MKWLLLGCFLGSQRSESKSSGRHHVASLSSPERDASTTRRAGATQESAAVSEPGGPVTTFSGPEASVTRSCVYSPSTDHTGASGGCAAGFAEQQELAAPRLSLDCGVGVGPSPPEPSNTGPPATSTLSFSQLPATNHIPPCFMARGSVDTASGEVGVESSAASDGSNGALFVRGGSAAAVLAGPSGDINISNARYLVSRAFRGRASLDALLMLGALARAADEAGLAVTGGTPRLERIESGDLPACEEGHQDKQTQARSSRPVRVEAATRDLRSEWYADAETAIGPRLVPRAQHRGLRWPQQPGLNVSSNVAVGGTGGGSGSGGTAAAIAMYLGSSGGSASSGAVGPGVLAAGCPTTITTVVTAGLGHMGDLEFTFSPPVASSVRRSIDNGDSRGQHSDMLCQQPLASLNSQTQGLTGQVPGSNQILELFMRLVTNCSTAGDNDLPSSSGGGDRNSSGTTGNVGIGQGSRAFLGTDPAMPPAALLGVGAATAGYRKFNVRQSASERQRNGSSRRRDAGGFVNVPVYGGSSPAFAAAAIANASSALKPDGVDMSAPLLKLYGSHGGRRRNSWDTLGGSSGSAVAVAAAAAAALAAAGLLRGSVGGPHTYGGGGTLGGGYHSNSGRTCSSMRFWPSSSPLQEDSGPASMLLLGALSGGMSLGGTTSATSLVQLPTGSGSVRDVLSRIQQQQQQQQLLTMQEGGHAATSSSSWSTNTGLASLFDAHLTAALRRNGAVGTFKRALRGSATLSQTSYANSQITGNLGLQDTSVTLTSSLMMFNLGSTVGSNAAAGAMGSGAGMSHLGAASAAHAAAAAAGILVSALPPPRIRGGHLFPQYH